MKITLLGDSIRQQYAPRVKELLGDDFEVWYPADNCRFSKYTLRGLFDWRTQMEGTDIVHWNNGHWDINDLFGTGKAFTSEEEFVKNMLDILEILQKRYKVVIFATTTPVLNSNVYNKNSVLERYNDLIVPILKEKGVIINDLNSLLRGDKERYICSDTIHLTPEGIELCAEQVAKVIKEAAEALRASDSYGDFRPMEEKDVTPGAPVLI
jgi:lysophospholipase L1-like esterase